MFKAALAGWGLAGFSAGLLLVSVLRVPAPWMPTDQQRLAGDRSVTPIVFGSDVGLVLNYIKPDKAVTFDVMIGQLKAAMEETHRLTLCDQAARWKVVRSGESGPDGTAVYAFVIEPGLPHADYRISTLVTESIHRNPNEFYQRLVDLYASRQNVVNVASVWPLRMPDVTRNGVASNHLR